MVLFYVNYSLLKMWHVVARQFVSQRLHYLTFDYPFDLLTVTMGFFRQCLNPSVFAHNRFVKGD